MTMSLIAIAEIIIAIVLVMLTWDHFKLKAKVEVQEENQQKITEILDNLHNKLNA